ncbi:Homeobox associated leucine zipper protein [Quillaja saponaria]|uniref:Homeobox associated leucine zipper protein n=1 Tax=Quillaja saponaria TaxID=32244 RepID=A0AAD7Q7Q9_QUISA|nr:Homeobox associated leucine zipper protein [Quillaja saponaria]
MELALSLGDTPKSFSFLDKATRNMSNKDLGFCIALGEGLSKEKKNLTSCSNHEDERSSLRVSSSDPPLPLELLPFSPVPRTQQPSAPSQLRIPWFSDALGIERGTSDGLPRGLDVNRFPAAAEPSVEEADDGTALSSPNSAASSFQMDFSIMNFNMGRNKREHEADAERTSSRASDDDENGSTRKKLRLSKQQSAFLEESFKEHTTLNPKQKLALAKQLNLRPRQVEVWFQNRRARTKLKQTEVDCEYLKRCCETLTEENRRLQKELQELRALKASQPFYMQLPATTLTMCPSCERVATNTNSSAVPSTATAAATNQTTSTTTTTNSSSTTTIPIALSLNKPIAHPFNLTQAHMKQAQAHQLAS